MAPTNSLSIVTLNSWKGEGNYTARLRLMSEQLQSLEPDVVCLQEVLQTEHNQYDTAAFLAAELGMNFLFTPGRLKVRTVEGRRISCHSGLAILSNHDFLDHRTDRLPPHPKDPERLAQSAMISVNGTRVLITNLHLTHLGDSDDHRSCQLLFVIENVRRQAKSMNWLCCGDFNMVLDKDRLQFLQEKAELQISDCYLKGNGTLPGFTFEHDDSSDSKRIDYILSLSATSDILELQCSNSRVVLDRGSANGLMASDHYGVMTKVFL